MTEEIAVKHTVVTCPFCGYRGPVEQIKLIDRSTITKCGRCKQRFVSYPKGKVLVRK